MKKIDYYLELLLGFIFDMPAIIWNLVYDGFAWVVTIIKTFLVFIMGLLYIAAWGYFGLIVVGIITNWLGIVHLEINYYLLAAQLLIPIFLVKKGLPFIARIIANFTIPNLFLDNKHFRNKVKIKYGMNHAEREGIINEIQ